MTKTRFSVADSAGRFAEDLAAALGGARLSDRLALVRSRIPGRIVFTTSFGLEDQALAHLIFTERLKIEVATLDTGRLFPSTYRLWQQNDPGLL